MMDITFSPMVMDPKMQFVFIAFYYEHDLRIGKYSINFVFLHYCFSLVWRDKDNKEADDED